MELTVERAVDIGGRPVDNYRGWAGTPPFNLMIRYPVVVAPRGPAGGGMPTSIRIVGAPFADDVVIRSAAHADAPGSEVCPWVLPAATGDSAR